MVVFFVCRYNVTYRTLSRNLAADFCQCILYVQETAVVRACIARARRKTVFWKDSRTWNVNVRIGLGYTWKVLKCGAGEGWKRSVGPIM